MTTSHANTWRTLATDCAPEKSFGTISSTAYEPSTCFVQPGPGFCSAIGVSRRLARRLEHYWLSRLPGTERTDAVSGAVLQSASGSSTRSAPRGEGPEQDRAISLVQMTAATSSHTRRHRDCVEQAHLLCGCGHVNDLPRVQPALTTHSTTGVALLRQYVRGFRGTVRAYPTFSQQPTGRRRTKFRFDAIGVKFADSVRAPVGRRSRARTDAHRWARASHLGPSTRLRPGERDTERTRLQEMPVPMASNYLPCVATGATRDDAALQEGLARWVTAFPDVVRGLGGGGSGGGGTPRLTSLARAQGGQANETVLVDIGPAHRGMVVRLPPLEPTFPRLRPRAAGAGAERGGLVRRAGAGPGGRGQRSGVDRLALPGHAPRGG